MEVLAAGHGCVDACQGAVAAMLPFMIDRLSLSLTAASALVLAATAASSIVQPLFGAYSDRFSAPWLLPGGVVLACAGVAAAGIAPSFPFAFVAILLSGLGVAAYHPEGSRFANYVSGTRRATAMSYFSLGGNVGFALGPLVVTPMMLLAGTPGVSVLLVPGAVIGWMLWRRLPRLLSFRPTQTVLRERRDAGGDSKRAFAGLLVVICSRTFAFYTLLAMVPLYFINVLDTSDAVANTALIAMLAFGAVGTLVGGRLADKIGRRPVLIASLALQAPLLVAMTAVDVVPAVLAAGVFGFVAISSFSVTVVMGQEYMPSRIGLASGLTLGAAIGIGGLAAPFFGLLAEEVGLRATIHVLAVLPAVGALLALALPPAPSRPAVARAGEPPKRLPRTATEAR